MNQTLYKEGTRRLRRWWLALLLALLLLAGCDDGLYSGSFLFDGQHEFGPGEALSGDLLVRAGTAEFAAGSRLDGTLYMLGGIVNVAGEVTGDVAAVGGRLTLGPEAAVGGDLYLIGGEVEVDPGATIRGEVISNAGAALPLAEVGGERTIDDWLRLLAGALLLAGLGGLFVRGRPEPVENLGRAAVDHALVSGAVGLLLVLVLPATLVMMGFTVILVPLVIVLGVALFLLLGFGQVAIGYQLGDWLVGKLGWRLSPPWVAFGGTLLLLALFAIPVLGEGLLAITLVLALGALLLTRAGLRPYVPEGATPAEEVDPASYERPSGEPAEEEPVAD